MIKNEYQKNDSSFGWLEIKKRFEYKNVILKKIVWSFCLSNIFVWYYLLNLTCNVKCTFLLLLDFFLCNFVLLTQFVICALVIFCWQNWARFFSHWLLWRRSHALKRRDAVDLFECKKNIVVSILMKYDYNIFLSLFHFV